MFDHCIKFDDVDLNIGRPIQIILHRIRIPGIIGKVIYIREVQVKKICWT